MITVTTQTGSVYEIDPVNRRARQTKAAGASCETPWRQLETYDFIAGRLLLVWNVPTRDDVTYTSPIKHVDRETGYRYEARHA